jgi:hypothetical protein
MSRPDRTRGYVNPYARAACSRPVAREYPVMEGPLYVPTTVLFDNQVIPKRYADAREIVPNTSVFQPWVIGNSYYPNVGASSITVFVSITGATGLGSWWILDSSYTFSKVRLNTSGLSSGLRCRIGIYSCATPTFLPTALLFSYPEPFSLSSGGIRVYTFPSPMTLTAGLYLVFLQIEGTLASGSLSVQTEGTQLCMSATPFGLDDNAVTAAAVVTNVAKQGLRVPSELIVDGTLPSVTNTAVFSYTNLVHHGCGLYFERSA